MASSYTKLIEFKVNDRAIKAATVRLFRSLERIEKKLDAIGGKGGKGFTQVVKGAEKSAVAVEKLSKATVKFSDVSRGVRGIVQTTAVSLGILAKGAYDTTNSLSKLTGVYKPLGIAAGAAKGKIIASKVALLSAAAAAPLLTKALIAGAAAYVVFGSKTGSVIKGLVKLERAAKNATQSVIQFIKKAKVPKAGELTIFDKIMSAKGGGLVGLQKLLDQVTAAQARLISTNTGYLAQTIKVREVEKALNAELLERKRILDSVIVSEQRRTGIGATVKEAGKAGGLEGLKRLLLEAESIQNRMLSTDEKYVEQTNRVQIIQKAINKELAQRDVIMGKLNIKEQKSITLAERLRNMGGNVAGAAARSMRPGKGVEGRGLGLAGLGVAGVGVHSGQLAAGITPKLIDPIGSAVGGLATKMGLASIKATSFLGVLNAIGAAAMAHPNLIGLYATALMIWGNKVNEIALGPIKLFHKGLFGLGKVLAETNRPLDKLKTQLQGWDPRGLKPLTMEFKLGADAAKRLELATNGVTKARERLRRTRIDAGHMKGSGFGAWSAGISKQEIARAANKSAFGAAGRREAAIASHQDLAGARLAQIKGAGELLTIEQRINKVLERRGQILRGNQAVRNQSGGGMMSGFSGTRMGQAVLGGGFPLLFGGGPGAVLGGAGGGLIGGFAGGIAGSIIGQQFDRFAVAAAAVGDALKDPTKGLQKLSDMGIKVDETVKDQINSLTKLGKVFEAQILIEKEYAKVIGQEGVDTLKNLDDAFDDLKDAMSRLFLIASAELAPAFITLIDLATKFVNAITGDATQRAASNLDRSAFTNAMKQAREFAEGQGYGSHNQAAYRTVYNDKLTELSKAIVQANTPSFGTSSGGGGGRSHAGLADVEGANLKLLNQRIELLRVRESLDSKEIFMWEKKILHAETDVRLAEAANDKKSTAIILKEHQLKMLQLEKGYLSDVNSKYEKIGATIKNGIVDGIEAAVKGTKTLGEVASQVLDQIARQILTSGVNSFFLNWGNRNQGNWIGRMFGGQRAAGGPVTGGTSYLVGEKGPEIFTPRSSGNITANNKIGGGTMINVSVNATESKVSANGGEAKQLGESIAAAIQQQLVKERRPGGLLYS